MPPFSFILSCNIYCFESFGKSFLSLEAVVELAQNTKWGNYRNEKIDFLSNKAGEQCVISLR
jgi:hypothetical protein